MNNSQRKLKIIYRKVGSLTTDSDNLRSHPERSIASIKASLQEFGQQKPIVVDANDVVIAGNGTLEAARALGWEQVATVVSDLEGAKTIAYSIADNRTAELSAWSDELGDALAALRDDDAIDELATGFDAAEIERLAGVGDEPPPPDERNHDDLPTSVPAITVVGETVEMGRHSLHCGDCVEVMAAIEAGSIDAIVTDPPYGIGFMGKGWDCSVPSDDFAIAALRVLKPGGHLLAFAATRTQHRLMVALEDAGFELRDVIAWVQWQGFPKSLDVSKAIDDTAGRDRPDRLVGGEGSNRVFGPSRHVRNAGTPVTGDAKCWQGWGTALKPAWEPCVMARKPLDGTTVAANVLEHGTGGINVDGCRYAYGDKAWPGPNDEVGARSGGGWGTAYIGGSLVAPISTEDPGARFPANLYHCPKPSTGEREAGLEGGIKRPGGSNAKGYTDDVSRGLDRNRPRANSHPTVKPVQLMRWLVRLVTPPDGVVLETFAGSGTTMIAAELEGFRCVGIEQEPKYCDIARARLAAELTERCP